MILHDKMWLDTEKMHIFRIGGVMTMAWTADRLAKEEMDKNDVLRMLDRVLR